MALHLRTHLVEVLRQLRPIKPCCGSNNRVEKFHKASHDVQFVLLVDKAKGVEIPCCVCCCFVGAPAARDEANVGRRTARIGEKPTLLVVPVQYWYSTCMYQYFSYKRTRCAHHFARCADQGKENENKCASSTQILAWFLVQQVHRPPPSIFYFCRYFLPSPLFQHYTSTK